MSNRLNIKFVEGNEAIDILQNSDPYIEQMAPFERGIRMGQNRYVDQQEFKEYIAKQILAWDPNEINELLDLIKGLEEEFKKYNLKFPDTIKFIKTNGLEDIRECSGYCRKNTVVMSQETVKRMSRSFFAHELFHIASQNDPDMRYTLYKELGFNRCNEIELPAYLATIKVTNPDAPRLDVYINITHNGIKYNVVPIIFYNQDGPEGFFNRLYIMLLVITYDSETKLWKCDLDEEGDWNMYSVDEVDDFFEQTGPSHYYFHPEEILATRFATLITYITDDEYVHKLGEFLRIQ